uniref:HSF-type DNA-binding domain-containing protein n=1 Tax=Leptocylindrus danicus TaxID=163516 RepID=A0A7S2PSB1_9STRA|mmetsp:Transcript_9042/g.13474  ORF Transcript_9042/g.13474 Transcript_9042/m.13474 type:complete len:315 (+) Transcript_9042:24-968(+)
MTQIRSVLTPNYTYYSISKPNNKHQTYPMNYCSTRKRIVSESDDVPLQCQSSKRVATTAKVKPTPVFLKKLYHMLEQDDEISNIVSWSPDGISFIIYSIQSFSKKVLPKYFESSLSSFRRQLHYYGFQKVNDDPMLVQEKKSTPQSLIYRHEDNKFCSGRPDLLQQIRRTTRSADPKVEAQKLKQAVRNLEVKVSSLQEQVDELRGKMQVFRQFMGDQRFAEIEDRDSPMAQFEMRPRSLGSFDEINGLGGDPVEDAFVDESICSPYRRLQDDKHIKRNAHFTEQRIRATCSSIVDRIGAALEQDKSSCNGDCN